VGIKGIGLPKMLNKSLKKLKMYRSGNAVYQSITTVFNILVPFIITILFIFAILYILPSATRSKSESVLVNYIWPLNAFHWTWKFLTFQLLDNPAYDIWIFKAYLFNTCKFLFGSLILSAVLVASLLIWRFQAPNKLFNIVIRIIKFSSGLHVLIIALFAKQLWPDIENPLDVRLLFILALANGSLVELYNTLEAEFTKVMNKEYVLAGVAWGFNRYRFPLRELGVIFIEFLNARIPILFSSTIILEYVFALNGISYNIINYLAYREYNNIILGSALISILIITLNVMTEKFRYLLDPRIRHDIN